ncbi:hypothetical protein BJ166DRAFT_592508 [Pestalotiopsis sp. NC0098]|nr:hypothetical protein BJ166DRAFT_592508 [Pestalotiopsis sp. NC0098]
MKPSAGEVDHLGSRKTFSDSAGSHLVSLATSVYVASSARGLPSATDQTYSQVTAGYHSISESSLTEPPIYSIKVTQADLDNWEDDWVDEDLPLADDESAV